ncbi:ADP-ribose glycohydrolase MACROD2 isoform 2-T2 [Discoglossus pictus]
MSNSNKKKKQWKEEKDRLLKMTTEERSKRKFDKTPVSIKDIPSWMEETKNKTDSDDTPKEENQKNSLSEKVSLYNGDITLLEIDAIVNAANSSLLGGGGVDGCIHRASGSYLLAECRSLNGCQTGQAKITCGYDLPAKYVIHTVGPIARGQISEHHNKALASCYNSSLELAKENNIRTIAFPCISTGIYGFPNEPAANVALTTAKEWLKKNHNEMDRIIFCVFLEVDVKIYEKKISEFFPIDTDDDDNKDNSNDDEEETDENNKDTEQMPAQHPMKETGNVDEMTESNEDADEGEQVSPAATSEEEKGLSKQKITEVSNEPKDNVNEDVEMASQAMSQEVLQDLKSDEDADMESQDLSPSLEDTTDLDKPSNLQVSPESTCISPCEATSNTISVSPPADNVHKPEENIEAIADVEMHSQVDNVDGSNEVKDK